MKHIKKAIPLLLSAILLTSCSDSFKADFSEVTGNRTNGAYHGNFAYQDNCIYRSLEDGLYEYDLENKTVTRVVDYSAISEDSFLPKFAIFPGGAVILSNSDKTFDKDVDMDEQSKTYTVHCKLPIVNLKGEVKSSVDLQCVLDENFQAVDQAVISRFAMQFLIDKGWLYGRNDAPDRTADWIRYNLETKEYQQVCSGFLCIAGDFIYYNNENQLCRKKESDLSGEEAMSLNLKTRTEGEPKENDERAEDFFISSDQTVVFKKEIYSEKVGSWTFGGYWICKFGEEPKPIEFIPEGTYLAGYSDDCCYFTSDSQNSGETELPQDEHTVYKVNVRTGEQQTVYSSITSYPTIVGEKFLVLFFDSEKSIIYDIKADEIIEMSKEQ